MSHIMYCTITIIIQDTYPPYSTAECLSWWYPSSVLFCWGREGGGKTSVPKQVHSKFCFCSSGSSDMINFWCIVKPVYSGHRVRQPPPYYSHLVQAPSGKTPYIKHFFKFKAATSLLQPLCFSPWVIALAKFTVLGCTTLHPMGYKQAGTLYLSHFQ